MIRQTEDFNKTSLSKKARAAFEQECRGVIKTNEKLDEVIVEQQNL